MLITTVQRAGGGIFPLDEELRLERGSLSPALAREVVWLSGVVAYEQVSQVLERIGQYSVPPSTLWEHVQHHGERLVVYQARQQSQVSIERPAWETRRYQPQLRKGVSLDGGMVNIRGEGWKEFKTGVVSTLLPPDQQSEKQPDTVCQDMHYTAVLGSVEQFAPALWALAVQQQVPYAGHVAVTADGTPWIWTLAADLFPCSTQIVDWFHAIQHLAEAAQLRYPTDPQAAKPGWLNSGHFSSRMESGRLLRPSANRAYSKPPPILKNISTACCTLCFVPKDTRLAPGPLKAPSSSTNSA